jgi:preprotein translocase subunit SecY
MWIVLIVLIVAGLVFVTLARRRIPKTYSAINAAAWTIEGLLLLLAIVAIIYQLAGGRPF